MVNRVSVEKTTGTFSWWELATPNLEAAWRFYHGLFRWEKRDARIGPDQIYRICVLEGRDVGAMYQLDPEQLARKVCRPPGSAYVAVKSADEAAKQIAAAGGTILMPPFDVVDAGRMALFTDSRSDRGGVLDHQICVRGPEGQRARGPGGQGASGPEGW